MKICTLCKTEKSLDHYYKQSSAKDGLTFRCKTCVQMKNAASYAAKREDRALKGKAYREANRDIIAARKKKDWEKNRGRYLEAAKARRESRTPEQRKAYHKEKYTKNREQNLRANRERYHKNPEIQRAKTLERQRENKEQFNAYQRAYRKRKAAENPVYALEAVCRSRLLSAFRQGGYKKNTKTSEMVGCSFEELKAHLESLFEPGMTWENRGLKGWHIDHARPLASAKTPEELEALCHYTNLQPMWAEDNYAKGAKLPEELTA